MRQAEKDERATQQDGMPFREKFFPQELDQGEMSRYSRHLLLPEVGLAGQKKLKNSRVLLVGAGGLGSPLGLYLAAAGVGTIGLVDFDRVEENNLQRQIIHGSSDIGRLKTASARDGMLEVNPHITVDVFNEKLTSANALDIFRDFDVIADGSDNFPARYLINDACALLGKPDVFGALYRFEGQVSVFDARRGCCLRCLFPEPPQPEQALSCGEVGVLGALAGIVGSIQATETIKLILDAPASLVNRFLAFDAWLMRFHEFTLRKKADCPLCGATPSITELADYDLFCNPRPSGVASAHTPAETVSPAALKSLLDTGADIRIIDIRLPDELTVCRLPQAVSIPLTQLFRRMDELDPLRTTVLVCKKGDKSGQAVDGLRDEGYAGPLFSLRGGINAWADEVDASMPKY
jgi:adenylyltransferase/sulfurtransferase